MEKLYKLADTIFEINHIFPSTSLTMKEYEVYDVAPKYKINYSKEDIENYKREYIKFFEKFSLAEVEDSYIYKSVGYLLPLENKYIIHGSSVYLDNTDNGYLFTAPSGTGKSTHSRLLKKLYGDRITYINDDKPFIYDNNGEFYIYGGPWNGKEKISNNVKCKLKGIFIVERGNSNTATRIDSSIAIKHLIKQLYIPQGKVEATSALKCLIDLCKNVPIYILNINMEDAAAKASYEVMNNKGE